METTTMTAPMIDSYLDRAGGSWNSPSLTAESLDAMTALFGEIRKFAPNGRNGARVLYLCAERGPIEDFGNYEEMLEDGLVEDHADYEAQWQEFYPDAAKWYRLLALEDSDGFQCISVGHRFSLSRRGDTRGCEYGQDMVPLLHWLSAKAIECEAELRQGTYNRRREFEVPKTYWRGLIPRKEFWDILPEERQAYLDEFSKQDMDEFLEWTASPAANAAPKEGIRMTSGLFFQCCAWGYEANRYDGCAALSNRDLYKRHADGRDEGLCNIDEDSFEAFDRWFHDRERGGHPWEVCRGGNSTHVSLYVQQNGAEGYCLHVEGTSFGRSAEAIRFFLALRRHGMPVAISDACGLAARLAETDVIGIVPDGVMPFYCESLFPRNDILDFMNLPDEKKQQAEIIARTQWLPLEQARLAIAGKY